MRMRDDPKIKAIEWTLDLLADDLDSLSELDLSKRVLEALHYFGGQIPFTEQTPYPAWRNELKKVQHLLGDFLKLLVGASERVKASEDKQLSNQIGSSIKVEIFFKIDPEKMTVSYGMPLEPQPIITASREVKYIYDREALESYKGIIAYFYSLLNGLPTGAIKSCRECGRYFLHLTKKDRFFCSPKCGSRYGSRKIRERDPDGYRAKQREIMNRRYEEEQKEIHGPNVKIQRRTKKK